MTLAYPCHRASLRLASRLIMTTVASASDLTVPSALHRAVLGAFPALRQQPWHALTGGRSNRVWQVADVAIKLYRPMMASPLFPNDPGAEAMVLQRLAATGLAPELLHRGDGWIAYRHQSGQSWQSGPAQVAEVLSAIHGQSLPLRLLPMGSAAIARHADSFAPVGGLPAQPQVPEVAALARPRLVHGDAVPGNMIVAGQRLTMIDWQCPGLGDPVDDIALFLSPAMQLLYRGAALTEAEAEAFLAAYADRAVVQRYLMLRPLLHWRIVAHCAWRAAQGDADYAAACRLEIARL